MDAVMPVANTVGMKASSGHPRVGQEHRGGPVVSHSYIESVIHLEIICQFEKFLFIVMLFEQGIWLQPSR